MMLHRSSVTVAVLLALACSPAVAATLSLPAGTLVTVHAANDISSGDAAVGQRFAIQVAEPVVVNGRVLIDKGAGGTGQIVSVTKAHGKSAGQMSVEFLNVPAADGRLVRLSSASRTNGDAEKGKASTATIVSTAILGPIGLFAHNFVKGKDVVIGPNRNFSAWVKTTTLVNVH